MIRLALLLLACAVLSTPAATPPHDTPGVRNAHGAAYDPRDRTLLVIAGASADRVHGDTWRWRDGSWRVVRADALPPRTFPAVAFDPARGELVLFGGNRVLFGDSSTPAVALGDTWLLRGESWRQVRGGGPSPRSEAAMAYDPRRERSVLFGGYEISAGGRTRMGDTWEWDGRRWIAVSRTGPPPRSGAAIAYDARLGAVVLFGGSGGPLGDTWSWNGQVWTRVPVPAAPGRFNSAMAADPSSGTLVRFGGWDGEERVSETWELHERGWVLVDTTGPAARNHATLVSAPDRASLLLFGGHDGDRVFGDLWERRDGRWVALESREPARRIPNGH